MKLQGEEDMSNFTEYKTENELNYVNKVLADKDLRVVMKKLFSSFPDNVKAEIFTNETDGIEKYFNKDGRRISGGVDAVFTIENNSLTRVFSYENGSVQLRITINKVLFDNGSNNSYSAKIMKKRFNENLEAGVLPRVILTYRSKPTPVKIEGQSELRQYQIKEIEKVLFENVATHKQKLFTSQRKKVYVPEQVFEIENTSGFNLTNEREDKE